MAQLEYWPSNADANCADFGWCIELFNDLAITWREAMENKKSASFAIKTQLNRLNRVSGFK